jgi:hypothetical protein
LERSGNEEIGKRIDWLAGGRRHNRMRLSVWQIEEKVLSSEGTVQRVVIKKRTRIPKTKTKKEGNANRKDNNKDATTKNLAKPPFMQTTAAGIANHHST